jgi:hypothetical protein
MSIRALVAILVNIVMTVVLFFVTVVHATFATQHKDGAFFGQKVVHYYLVLEDQMMAPILIIMGAVTVWWMLGRRKTKPKDQT